MNKEIREYDNDVCFEIGQRIQKQRLDRNIKSIELASYLNIGKNQMSRIESGKANCTIPQLYCIAQVLECSVDFLLFGKSQMNYSPDMVELVNDLFAKTVKLKQNMENSL